LPISIITDFEEFAVYDCTPKPLPTDKASKARIRYLTFREYLNEFDFLWETFSKEKVLKGSFDRFVQSDTQKKGTTTVDQEFLQSLDSWRSQLAVSLVRANPHLTEEELNFAVQQTMNRIVFLRIAEDRGVEQYDSLRKCVGDTKSADNIFYNNLFRIFERADEKYNSGLFDFEKDTLSVTLKVENKTLKSIISDLYYPGPYDFSVMPVEILGSAYEQFLGKTIRVTSGHSVKIEEKPEVRKAGGVYYTPEYVVDYIVQNTVGKLLEGKTPKDAAKIKIVDPACGSGSFLIGAFQYLLDWHRDYYLKNAKSSKGGKKDPLTPAGKLATSEKKRILLNNIFGVDIDVNAVEITKLSLLLKCMEGETTASIETMQHLFHERVLPSIDDNICNGNSLIDTDFYDNQLDFKEEKKVKPFSWKHAFPNIFKQGGFDIVISNPPYGALLGKNEKEYLAKKFPMVADFETSQYFIMQAYRLLQQEGYISVIIPNTMLVNLFAKQFRDFIYNHFSITKIADLSNIAVFTQATVRTVIPVLTKGKPKGKIVIENYGSSFAVIDKTIKIKQTEIKNWETWDFQLYQYWSLIENIKQNTIPLNNILEISQGLIPYDKYRGHDKYTIKNRIWHANYKKDKTYKKELRGGDVKRYSLKWNGKNWISYGEWLAAPRKPDFFVKPRILIREITDGIIHAVFTAEEYYNNPSIINCISRANNQYSMYFLLGIINSRLLSMYHTITSPKARKGAFPKILINDIRKLPIPALNLSKKMDKRKYDKIIELVDHLLQLNKEKSKAKLQTEISRIETKITYCEDKINSLVYELYGLTEEEIKIVEDNE
jgi:type I restriction-modification system DNA methylase subunit